MRLFEKTVKRQEVQVLPAILLDELVCFPGAVLPLYINAKPALKALETAMADKRFIVLLFRLPGKQGNDITDVSPIGTMARVVQVMKLPSGGGCRLLIEGLERVAPSGIRDGLTNPSAQFQTLDLDNSLNDNIARLMRACVESFQRYAALHKKITREILSNIEAADTPHRLVDLAAANASFSYTRRLELLRDAEAAQRLEELAVNLETESELLELKSDISGRVKKRMEQSQKEYFLNEQIKELHKELGKEDDDAGGIRELEVRLLEKILPDEVRTKATTELKRLSRLQAMTPEAGIIRTWLECILDLPWEPTTGEDIHLVESERILNEDHYDLVDAKDRILDYLAVRNLKGDLKAPILCLVGPPGTGKTSLGKSIARAMGRKFVRISLGGLRDEAEIRGHRRTYVGAMPGKIIQGIRKIGVSNSVFLLDEIDKLSSDHRGDPSSALLEVLDPEQNSTFTDHYLELSFDLSQTLFIATANKLDTIPAPLRDRMEIIEISGYSRYDKLKIATGYIIPRTVADHGLAPGTLTFENEAISTLIDEYTMEAGVRNLDRAIVRIIRKVVRAKVTETPDLEIIPPTTINKALVRELLKKTRIRTTLIHKNDEIGVANGMAWTEYGGTLMPVEVSISEGKGEIILTGSLGDVMKESARIALSFLKSAAGSLSLPSGFIDHRDVHIHVPEGAIPKDGPSAGITLCAALASAFTGIPLRGGIAMTGELTLTGRVLPVGGVREKILAAHRHGIRNIILPEKNRLDSAELPEEVLADLVIHHVSHLQEVLDLALKRSDVPVIAPKARKKTLKVS